MLDNNLQHLPPELMDSEAVSTELAERSLSDFITQAWPLIETVPYKHNWHIDAISEHLEAVARCEINGILLINIPFRCMKSRIVNVMFQPWIWAQNPDPLKEGHGLPVRPGTWMGPGAKVLISSHTGSLAVRDSVTARRLLDSHWYQSRWGDRVKFTSDQNQKQRYENTVGGYRVSSSREGVLGDGGDILIADDPIKREEANSDDVRRDVNDWWDESFSNRTNDPERSVFVVIMQRLHQNDTSGHILDKESNVTHLMLPMEYEPQRCSYSHIKTTVSDPEPIKAKYLRGPQRWVKDGDVVEDSYLDELNQAEERVVYKADPRKSEDELLWSDRFSDDRVTKFKNTLGSYAAAGQFQQRPAPREGGMFQRAWFSYVRAAPVGTKFVRGWDLAASTEKTSAYTAGVKIGKQPDGRYIIAHAHRDKLSAGGVETLLKNTAGSDGQECKVSIPQDPGQSGKAQAQYLVKQMAPFSIRATPESGDKVTRAEPLSAQAEAGNVDILKTGDPVKDKWIEEFLDELCTFPNSKYKDQTDAASRAFNELQFGDPFDWYVGS